jgi:alpha/beta superfamily hydrolase
MAQVFHRKIFLEGPAGSLEALLWTVAAERPAEVALVCHPHPLFGGTMHNKVVFQAAKALHEAGMPVLRFNFRGAGLSHGEHDQGRGEQGDVRAAIDYLAAEFPGAAIVLAGFSFGSYVGLCVGCADARVTRVIGLGIAVNKWDFSYLSECRKPKLFISGANDEFASVKKIEEVFAEMPPPKKLRIVDGVDHFFTGKLEEVGREIDEWVQSGLATDKHG